MEQEVLDIAKIVKETHPELEFKREEFDYNGFTNRINKSTLTPDLKEYLCKALEVKKDLINSRGDFLILNYDNIANLDYLTRKNRISCNEDLEWLKGILEFIDPIANSEEDDCYTPQYFSRPEELDCYYTRMVPLKILRSLIEDPANEHVSFEELWTFANEIINNGRDYIINAINRKMYNIQNNPIILDHIMDLDSYIIDTRRRDELLEIIAKCDGCSKEQKAYMVYISKYSGKVERSYQRFKIFRESGLDNINEIEHIESTLSGRRKEIAAAIITNNYFKQPVVLYCAYQKCIRKIIEERKVTENSLKLLAAIYLNSPSENVFPEISKEDGTVVRQVPKYMATQEHIFKLACKNGVTKEDFYNALIETKGQTKIVKVLKSEREAIVKAIESSNEFRDPIVLTAAFEKAKRKYDELKDKKNIEDKKKTFELIATIMAAASANIMEGKPGKEYCDELLKEIGDFDSSLFQISRAEHLILTNFVAEKTIKLQPRQGGMQRQ